MTPATHRRSRAYVIAITTLVAGGCQGLSQSSPTEPLGVTVADTITHSTDVDQPTQATNPRPSWDELVDRADLVIFGEVVDVSPALDDGSDGFAIDTNVDQTATIRVYEVLKGEAPGQAITVRKPAALDSFLTTRWYTPEQTARANHQGAFFLDEADGEWSLYPEWSLFGDGVEREDIQSAIADTSPPTDEQARAEADALLPNSNLVLSGWVEGSSDISQTDALGREWTRKGTLHRLPDRMIGSLDEPMEVQVSDDTGWMFRVGGVTSGSFFVDASTTPPTVINSSAPGTRLSLKAADIAIRSQ